MPDTFPELAGVWAYARGGNLNGSVYHIVIEADGQIWGQPGYGYSFGQGLPRSGGDPSRVEKGQLSRNAAGATSGSVNYLKFGITTGVTVIPTSGGGLSYSDGLSGGAGLGPTSVNASEIGAWRSNATTSVAPDVINEGTLTVTGDRKISGTGFGGGCSFSGELTPVAGSRYFKLKLGSTSGSCALTTPISEANGVAFVVGDGDLARFYVLWHGADRKQYFWSAGVR